MLLNLTNWMMISLERKMARKLSKSIEEYLTAEGWSSKKFLKHAEFAFNELKELKIYVGRSVIYITNPVLCNMIKAYVHLHGRTSEWVTFTDEKGIELESVHFSISHEEFVSTIRRLVDGQLKTNHQA
jgi:hypothetical protein